MTTHDVAAGGYRYLEAVFQYSGGVRALEGYHLERMRLRHPLPLAEGFARIEKHLAGLGLPLASFCACELRFPAQFSEEEFRRFNESYVETLRRWGVFRWPAAMSRRRSIRRLPRPFTPSAMPGRAGRWRPISSSPAAAK
jgi:hypothetical protein